MSSVQSETVESLQAVAWARGDLRLEFEEVPGELEALEVPEAAKPPEPVAAGSSVRRPLQVLE